MRTQYLKILKRWLIFSFLGIILSIVLSVVVAPCPTGSTTKKPYFIDRVWPPPGSKIPVGCFTKKSISPILRFQEHFDYPGTISNDNGDITPSIAVFINRNQIDQQIDERIFLYIDNKISNINPKYISITDHYAYDRNNPLNTDPLFYFFAWYPMLPPGEHTARFEIIQRDGTIYEYEWSFTITWW